MEINEAMNEIQTVISSVLKNSTSQTLKQYENHMYSIEAEYLPSLSSFQILPESSCRLQAELILNTTTTFLGFDSSNCANEYDKAVSAKLNVAQEVVGNFSGRYGDIQSIVVKSFIGYNKFTQAEDIQEKIDEIFDLVTGEWIASSPKMRSLETALAEDIAAQNEELSNCHVEILNIATHQFSFFKRMVETCTAFHSSKRTKRSLESHDEIFEQFQAQFEKLSPYKWKA